MEPTLLGALGTGLLGGLGHCAGMCGPLVAAISLMAGSGRGPGGSLAVHLLYNAGRVTTYAFAGMVMGLTGSFVNVAGKVAGLQDAVAVLAGALMILMGLGAAGLLPFARRFEERVAGRIFGAVRGVLEGGTQGRAYALGLMLGFLPCGLSYSIFMGAAATGSPVKGALFALAFGLGTAATLLAVGGATALLSARVKGVLHRVGGLAVALLGLRFLLQGLGVHAL